MPRPDLKAAGPGGQLPWPAIVIRSACDDLGLNDPVTGVFETIRERERGGLAGSGDHFATAGANTRVRNTHEKPCLQSPLTGINCVGFPTSSGRSPVQLLRH